MSRSADILVVDDETSIVDLIAEILHEEGYRVRRAYTGISALAQIAASEPSMMLLDLSMPDMAGATLLQHIRAQGLVDLPVVIMSAGSHLSESLMSTGAIDFLPKPFDISDLVRCVARYLPASSMEQVNRV